MVPGLVFLVSHMSIHTQKVHSCSHWTRKTGECFQTEDLCSSFPWMKPAAWHLQTFLDWHTVQTSLGLKLLWLFRIHSCLHVAFMGAACIEWIRCHIHSNSPKIAQKHRVRKWGLNYEKLKIFFKPKIISMIGYFNAFFLSHQDYIHVQFHQRNLVSWILDSPFLLDGAWWHIFFLSG